MAEEISKCWIECPKRQAERRAAERPRQQRALINEPESAQGPSNRSTDVTNVADAGNGQSSGTPSQQASESATAEELSHSQREDEIALLTGVNNSITQRTVSNPPVATTARHSPHTDMTMMPESQTTSPNQVSLPNRPQRL